MQQKVYEFVESHSKDVKGKVLDIGSLNVNGSLRELFKGSEGYTGLDMREGNNVDVVANAHKLPFEDDTFDCVTCVETLEHDDNPFKTLSEIHRVLKLGGKVILAASGINFPKHEYPFDYFRYTADGIKVLLKDFYEVEVSDDNNEAYGIGIK